MFILLCILMSNIWEIQLFHILTHICYCQIFKILVILIDCNCYLIYILICVSQMSNDVEHLFMTLFATCELSFLNCLLKFFVHCLKTVLVSFSLNCWILRTLYIIDSNASSNIFDRYWKYRLWLIFSFCNSILQRAEGL